MSIRSLPIYAYDLVFAAPTMDFVARVGRSGKYAVPLMDELLVRVIHSASGLTIGAVATLLRLTAAQMDSFLEPLLRSNLLTITDEGLLGLGARGEAAMAHASGEPPKLTKVEEVSEFFRIDLIDMKFSVSPRDKRSAFGSIDVNPDLVRSRSEIRTIAQNALLSEHSEHMAYLEEFGYRHSPAKEIEYIIDIDEGRGGKTEVNVHVQLDGEGHGVLDFCDFRNGEQLQLRRHIVEKVTASCRAIPSASTSESRRMFALLVAIVQSKSADTGSLPRLQTDVVGEFWGEESISCLGRLESRDGKSLLKMFDRVIARLGLLKGDQERRAGWIVILASASLVFAKGRDYFELIKTISTKLKKRSPSAKILLVVPSGADIPESGAFSKFVDAVAQSEIADQEIAGLDGIFVPGEFAYVAIADTPRDRIGIATQNSLVTVDAQLVCEVARKVFSCNAFNQLRSIRGLSEADWSDVHKGLRSPSEQAAARVLRLKPRPDK